MYGKMLRRELRQMAASGSSQIPRSGQEADLPFTPQ